MSAVECSSIYKNLAGNYKYWTNEQYVIVQLHSYLELLTNIGLYSAIHHRLPIQKLFFLKLHNSTIQTPNEIKLFVAFCYAL